MATSKNEQWHRKKILFLLLNDESVKADRVGYIEYIQVLGRLSHVSLNKLNSLSYLFLAFV